jgi:hypothetical protein
MPNRLPINRLSACTPQWLGLLIEMRLVTPKQAHGVHPRATSRSSRKTVPHQPRRGPDAGEEKPVIEQGFLAACKRSGRLKNDHHFNGGARRGMMGLFAVGKRVPAPHLRTLRKTAAHRP